MSSDHAQPHEESAQDDPVATAALDWFVRLRNAKAGATDPAAFVRWRDADPAHAEAYAELAALWTGMDALPSPLPNTAIWGKRVGVSSRWRALWIAGGLAASLMLCFATPRLWIDFTADMATSTGQVQNFALADGSRVTLDGDSAIDISMDAGARRIRLLRGRAWFAVAHEARSFTVAVGEGEVRDIGTAFEVTRRRDGGEVTVTQGIVALSIAGHRAIRLTQGAGARFFDTGQSRVVATPSVPLGWIRGRLQFVSTPVADVLDDLARRGAGRTLYIDEAIARRRLTGVVNLADPFAARDTILAKVNARGRRAGPWLVVTSR